MALQVDLKILMLNFGILHLNLYNSFNSYCLKIESILATVVYMCNNTCLKCLFKFISRLYNSSFINKFLKLKVVNVLYCWFYSKNLQDQAADQAVR